METKTAKVFKSGNHQAIRLPENFRTDSSEFLIQKMGDSIVLTPINNRGDSFRASLDLFSEDFMNAGRSQPPMQERGDF